MPGQKKKFTEEEIRGWTEKDVLQWLVSKKLDLFQDEFKELRVTGARLLEMTSDDIKAFNSNDKQKKAMKKALASLPGNSASGKTRSKKTSKQNTKGSEPLPPPPPPLPSSGPPPPPPIPSGSSRPMFTREQFPPPAGDDDLYDDPSMAIENDPNMWGQQQDPQEMIQEEGYGEPTDIYDCVDEMETGGPAVPPPRGSNQFHPGGAPPPPIYPPQQNSEYAKDEDIYVEGDEVEEDGSFNNSFSSSVNESEDDYLSPYEDEDIDPELGRPRNDSEEAIRAVKGKFFAHGLTAHTGINVHGSPSPKAPRAPPPPDDEFEDDQEIYDCVPDQDGEIIDEDIYDIPPEEVVASVKSEEQSMGYPPSKLPPKPKFPMSAPPPEQAPPPYEPEEDFYDEGAGGDVGYMEDVYDIPAEAMEEHEQQQVTGKPPAPPPPASSPPPSPPPIEEDIYDTADLDQIPDSPPPPSPPLPTRPPKSNNIATPPISRGTKPSSSPGGSPFLSRSPFNKPVLKKPIESSKGPVSPPSPVPPSSSPLSPTVPLPPRPPKADSSKAPPLPPPISPPTVSVSDSSSVSPSSVPQPPPPPPPAGQSVFKKPPLRAPIDSPDIGAPPRPPSDKKPPLNAPKREEPKLQDSLQATLARLSPATKRVNQAQNQSSGPDHASKQSPLLDRSNLRHVDNKKESTNPVSGTSEVRPPPTGKPPLNKVTQEPADSLSKLSFKNTISKPTGSKFGSTFANKPAPGPKVSRISNLMKQFENKKAGEDKDSSEDSAGSSPVISPVHKLGHPPKPVPGISPLSGRKLNRKDSVDKLMQKFGGKMRSPSPDTGKPILPPKSPGLGSKSPKLGGGRNSDVPPPSLPDKPSISSPPSKESDSQLPAKPWMKKPPLKPQEEKDEVPPPPPPSGPSPAKPWMKKQLGKPPEEKNDGTNSLPAKPWMKKPLGKPPEEKNDGTNSLPSKPWMKKPKEKPQDEPPAKPWMKKPLEKPQEVKDETPKAPLPAKPWMKKPLEKAVEDKDEPPPPTKPWMKKPIEKTSEEKNEPALPAKPWMKKPISKPQDEQPPKPSWVKNKPQIKEINGDSSPEMIEEEPPPPRPPGVKPWMKTSNEELPPKGSVSPNIGKKSAPPPAGGPGKEVPSPDGATKKFFSYKPYSAGGSSADSSRDQPNSAESDKPKLPDRIKSENSAPALPGRNPPPSYRAPPEPEVSAPSLPSRNPPSHRPPPEPDAPSLPGRNPPSHRPPLEPESSAPSLPSRNPPSVRPPPEPESSAPSLPSRNPPSFRPPPEPSLPSRNPPSFRPPPEPESSAPSLPSRNPPSFRPPPEPESSAPSLPSRNPPTRRPSEHDPPLPQRPGQAADPEVPALPDRTQRGGKQLPPDLPSSRPPDIPSKRVPEPLPSSEPSIPNRPLKAAAGSPVGQTWYHSNLDRKRAEAILRKYGKDGTFIVRDSTKIPGEYSLSLWYGGGIRHLRIRLRPDKKFVLGEEKSDEHAFTTLVKLVEHHRHEPFHLKSGGETTLKYECPR